MKHLALVTHEFGLLRNGGGIASYLYGYSNVLLEKYHNIRISILTCHYPRNCDLYSDSRITIIPLLSSNLSELGGEVLKRLKEIRPDYVEVTDYLALCLESILYKNTIGKELRDTVFMVYTHTASREIYLWGGCGSLKQASKRVRVPVVREWAQMALADILISPSRFLQNYLPLHYGIAKPGYIPYTINSNITSKSKLTRQFCSLYETENLQEHFIVSYLSRFENRKNQQLLVNVFLRFIKEEDPRAVLILVGNSMIDNVNGRNIMLNVYDTIPKQYRKNFMFFEFATASDKKKIFAVSNLTVMTSPYENFPFAMIETICNGVPIMASKYSGCKDYMGPSESLTIFDPYQEDDLYRKLVFLSRMPEFERRQLALLQQKNLLSLCTLENSVTKKLRLYEAYQEASFPHTCDLLPITHENLNERSAISGMNDILLCEDRYAGDVRPAYKKLAPLINRHPGTFIFSVGGDCLHTTVREAIAAGFPLVFHNIVTEEGILWTDILKKELLLHSDSYFCIPLCPNIHWTKNVFKILL